MKNIFTDYLKALQVMKMMKSSFEETNIPGLYDWKQKIGFFVQFMSFVIFLISAILAATIKV